MDQIKIGRFLAELRKEKGLTQRNVADRLGVSEKTVSKWECGNGMPEVVFMEPLCSLYGILVNELLAGERLPILDMLKKMDYTRLDLARQLEFEQLKLRIFKLYGLDADNVETSEMGAGSLTYFISCGMEKYVVKYPSENEMNHAESEPQICDFLADQGVPVCEFVPNKSGKIISTDENGRIFHVQRFIDGEVYGYNSAPQGIVRESAVMLAKIHVCLRGADKRLFPVGIGGDFFRYRTPQAALEGYKNTLKQAEMLGDMHIINDIKNNMDILSRFPDYCFDISHFTVGNTHGDYMITQLICKDGGINGVIDWTTACRHPLVWEIVRSYVYASPLCADGEIDIDDFTKYLSAYLEYGQLNSYDIENMGRLFFYFTAVCNFYGQYFDSLTRNRTVYLQQAQLSAKLLRWFDLHIDEFTEVIKNRFPL